MTRKTKDAVILQLHGEGKSQREIAKALKCSKTAVLKRLRKLLSVNQTSVNLTKPNMLRKAKVLVNIGTPNTLIRR